MIINESLLLKYKQENTVVSLDCKGDSMAPLLKSPCVIYVICCDLNKIIPGDIIVFLTDRGIVCHRCIRVLRNELLERGDNCVLWNRLNPVGEINIIGKVFAFKNGTDSAELYIDSFDAFNKLMLGIGMFGNFISTNNGASVDEEFVRGGVVSKLIHLIVNFVFSLYRRRNLDDQVKKNHN